MGRGSRRFWEELMEREGALVNFMRYFEGFPWDIDQDEKTDIYFFCQIINL